MRFTKVMEYRNKKSASPNGSRMTDSTFETMNTRHGTSRQISRKHVDYSLIVSAPTARIYSIQIQVITHFRVNSLSQSKKWYKNNIHDDISKMISVAAITFI